MVISLVGPLGSGKTTLSKGIAKGLLITDVIVSPSYMIARSYQGRMTMHHIDAYRVSTLAELAEVGLDDYLPPESGISIVEWPDRIDGLVDISTVQVTIELLDDEDRSVSISKRS